MIGELQLNKAAAKDGGSGTVVKVMAVVRRGGEEDRRGSGD